jgi:hypothetical protein
MSKHKKKKESIENLIEEGAVIIVLIVCFFIGKWTIEAYNANKSAEAINGPVPIHEPKPK